MKTLVIFFCLLVALCSAQRFPSNPSLAQQAAAGIKKAKSNVQDINSGIDRTSNNYEMDINRQISNFWSQAYGRITDIRDRQLKYIKEKLEEAKQTGKNAEACLNAVSAKMTSGARTGYNEVDANKNQANQQAQNEIQAFKNMKATGQQLINQLDRIGLECGTSPDLGTCMISKLGLVNMEIRQYQQTVSQKERELSSSKNRITLAQMNANQSAISKVLSVSSSTIYEAADCLKD